MPHTTAPVQQKERIAIIDSLRGVAILGILLMNIPSFAYAIMGYDPSVSNESGTINYYVWYFVRLFPDGTQRALFSMLFGAGILLFISGKEKLQDSISPLDYFLRRQLWLIFFGLVNIYVLLWHGDILFDYGCYGFLMLTFRLWSPRKLIIAAGVCFLFMLARENRDLYLYKRTIARGEAVEKLDTTVNKLTPRQYEYLSAMQEIRERSTKASKLKRMEKENMLMTGSYSDVYDTRTGHYLDNLIGYTYMAIWDVIEFMLLGMALFKLGVLSGQVSTRVYALMCIIGLGGGLYFSYLNLHQFIDAGFNGFDQIKNTNVSFYELGRTLRSLGILGLLMLMFRSGVFKWFFSLLRPVGQMAFTNYLMQSLICAFIFYGIGFGYYGKLPRYQVYEVVLGIWVFQIIFSHFWLRYFRYGPFEWIWRQLTYWKKLPIRKERVVLS